LIVDENNRSQRKQQLAS